MTGLEKLIGLLAALFAIGGVVASLFGQTNLGISSGLALGVVLLFFLAQILREARRQKRSTELLRESSQLTRDAARGACNEANSAKREVVSHSRKIRALIKDQFQMSDRRDRTQVEALEVVHSKAVESAAQLNALVSAAEKHVIREGRSTRAALRDATATLTEEVEGRSRQVRSQVVAERRSILEGVAKSDALISDVIAFRSGDVRNDIQIVMQKWTAQIDSLRDVVDAVEVKVEEDLSASRAALRATESLVDASLADSLNELQDRLSDQQVAFARMAARADGLASVSDVEEVLRILGQTKSEMDKMGEECRQSLTGLTETLDAFPEDVSNSFGRVDSGLAHIVARQAKESTKLIVAMRSETQEVEALMQLYSDLEPRWVMPSLGRWALDARSALHLRQLVEDKKPKRILEFGGGSSTVWLAYLCEKFDAELISIDHHPKFHQRTRDALERHDLSGVVDTRLGVLEDYDLDGESFSWYARSSYSDLSDIDMLFIDGPPSTTGSLARYPALPLLKGALCPGALVLLDDADRPDEITTLERWNASFAGFTRIHEGVSRLAVLAPSDS